MRDWKTERLEILINLKKYDQALKILNILLKKYKNNIRIREKIASIYLLKGDYK